MGSPWTPRAPPPELKPRRAPIGLTIAGSDPSGAAGVQADLKAFHQHGLYGMSVITLITAQGPHGVESVSLLEPSVIGAQLRVVLRDLPPDAIKIGALGSAAAVEEVAAALEARPAPERATAPVVLDPVLVSTSGATLLSSDAKMVLLERLIPLAALVTPNRPEAEALTGLPVRSDAEAEEAGRALLARGARAVLIKGGHREGAPIDLFFAPEGSRAFPGARIRGHGSRGTGCALASAIAARLALGHPLPEAVGLAKRWLERALAGAPAIGARPGPLDFFAPLPDPEEGKP